MQKLVVISNNRLFAEALGAAIVSSHTVSSYVCLPLRWNNAGVQANFDPPAIVVIDIIPPVDAAEAMDRIRRIVGEYPASNIIAIGDRQCADYVIGCIESGARSFVTIHDSLDDFVLTVKALREGQCRCSSTVIELALRRIRELSATKGDGANGDALDLTPREVEVLDLVEKGLLNKEIARQLGIAVSTVKNHLHAIFEKLQVRGRRQAVRRGIAIGILPCESERLAC
jgi:DNA-binding NarL/FixJ family response regulator